MNKDILYHLNNELSGNVKEALNVAIQAIYFADNSDYKSALYDISLLLLDGAVADEDLDESLINELVHYLNPDWN